MKPKTGRRQMLFQQTASEQFVHWGEKVIVILLEGLQIDQMEISEGNQSCNLGCVLLQILC